jgi:hypothetical protein
MIAPLTEVRERAGATLLEKVSKTEVLCFLVLALADGARAWCRLGLHGADVKKCRSYFLPFSNASKSANGL